MTQLRSKLMLLLSLVMLGWGLCTWLEEGAPWSASKSSRGSRTEEAEPVDVRELIAAQASRTSATAQESTSTSHDNRRQVELTGGTLAAESTQTTTPTWLTGEIE